MKLKATDAMHLSELRASSLHPGEQFEVSDATGQELVERGLATEVKAAPPHANKMADAPLNKVGKAK